jgi:acetylornithine deacetylase/succinyl-diaminopimelate desuccinylase-like protein
MTHDTALQYAHDRREHFLSELTELLRIPSISTLPEHRSDMERAANRLRDQLQAIGFEAEIIAGEGHPLVYAEWLKAPGAPTILVYGHYDVQPADPIELWKSPPFEPSIRDGNIYARGSSDDKGQILVSIAAAETLLQTTGSLPVNVKFLIEGEEEYGGGAVAAYIKTHGERLRADVAQIADGAMFADGIPTIDTGLRGTVYTEITARGAAGDLHSGIYGGIAPNPLNALAHIIAGVKDRDGRICIPGFYDDVEMPSEEVLRSWKNLPVDPETLRAEIGSTELVGEPGFSPLERTWARPTLDVHGIVGGFTAEGAKTVIPSEATAKISMRIVPNQDRDRVFEAFRQYAFELALPGIVLDVRLLHGGNAVVVPDESPFVEAAGAALRDTFGRPAVLARSGGSIPVVGVIKEALGIDTVLMGWGLPDDNLHAPNEKLRLQNFFDGIDATVRFWRAVGASAGATA